MTSALSLEVGSRHVLHVLIDESLKTDPSYPQTPTKLGKFCASHINYNLQLVTAGWGKWW